MKASKLILGVMAGVTCTFSHLAFAQSGGGQSQGEPSMFRNGESRELTQEQTKQLGDYMDKAKAFNRKDLKNAPSKEESMQRAAQVIAVLKLSCKVKDAELVSTSSENVKGKLYQTDMYEAACAEGTGYFLRASQRVKKSGGKPEAATAEESIAMSCFAAEAVRREDEAKGVHSEFYCQLPDNGGGDIKVLAAHLLTATGTTCNVMQFKWFGNDQTAKTEYAELACDSGTGYLLTTALPGATAAPSAMNCTEAARKGLDCKLTKVAKPPTLQTFKDYLATTKVSCQVDDFNQIRVIGKENIKQRYVVEFKCAQQPNGLIAYIPVDGNTNPFETVDCVTAKQRGLACKLTVN